MQDDVRLNRRVGAVILVVSLAAAAATMLLSGITLAPGFVLHVDFERIANLKAGATVKMCGRDVGEIVAVRLAPTATFLQKKADAPGEPEEPRLVLDLWLRLRYQKNIHTNSEIFINQQGLLGDQYLEVGAPRGEPGPVVRWGQHVRGVDPPRIDRLLAQTYRNLQAVTALMRELRPLGREIAAAVDHLTEIQRQAGLGEPETQELYRRILANVEAGQAVYRTIQQGTHDGADLRALRAEIGRLGDAVAGDLDLVGAKIDLLMRRLDQAKELWAPARRARLAQALARLRRVVSLAQAIARDGEAIVAMVERGEGTVGAFLHDQELWDDFHYVHKILKSKPWSVIVKPKHPVRE